jgi:hypothetical protein
MFKADRVLAKLREHIFRRSFSARRKIVASMSANCSPREPAESENCRCCSGRRRVQSKRAINILDTVSLPHPLHVADHLLIVASIVL